MHKDASALCACVGIFANHCSGRENLIFRSNFVVLFHNSRHCDENRFIGKTLTTMSEAFDRNGEKCSENPTKCSQETGKDDAMTSEHPPTALAPADVDPPFDYTSMMALCVGMLAHSVVFTAPLPFVAFMVQDFGMAPDLDTAGYSAGWITGSFMLGRTISGLGWGLASDKWGRRPCLLLTMFNVALFGLLLGFSTNFATAVCLRLAIGLGNGFMGIAKTCISEIFPRCHELKAFGMLSGMWGLGLIVGPAIGGLLSRPAIQYPRYVSPQSIWGRFPYLLPCLCCAMLAVIGFVCLYVWLPETAGKAYRASRDADMLEAARKGEVEIPQIPAAVCVHGGEQTAIDAGFLVENQPGVFVIEAADGDDEEDEEGEGVGAECKHCDNTLFAGDEHASLSAPSCSADLSTDEQVAVDSSASGAAGKGWLAGVRRLLRIETEFAQLPSDSSHGEVPVPLVFLSPPPATATLLVTAAVEGRRRPTTVWEMLRDPQLVLLSSVYTCYCFAVMFVDETFPLWAVSSVAKGGLSWSSARVGSALACMGFGMVVFQVFCYEKLIKNCCARGAASTYLRLTCVSAVAIAVLNECAHVVYRQYGDGMCLYVTVVVVLSVYRATATSAFTTLGLVINASVDRDLRGIVDSCDSNDPFDF